MSVALIKSPDLSKSVLFVHPKVARAGAYYEFPLGMAYVYAVLKQQNVTVRFLDLCRRDAPVQEQIREALEAVPTSVVCTGGMSVYFNAIHEVVQATREIDPQVTTLVGGAMITADPPLSAKVLSYDYGVIGEAEITMRELIDAWRGQRDVASVNGLIYRTSENYVTTTPRGPIKNLDELPRPAYEDFDYAGYLGLVTPTCASNNFTILDNPRPASIIGSRSCPFKCTFCYHPLGQIYRQRSLTSIRDEIDFLVRTYQINILNLLDELFSAKRQRILDFCELIAPYNLRWWAQMRVSDVDTEIIRAMKKSGAYTIPYGVESMSPRILRSMNKRITVEQVDRALALTRSEKLSVQANLIFGDPEEDESTVRESLDWWHKNPSFALNLFSMRVIPDSIVYQGAVKRGVIADKEAFLRQGFPLTNVSRLSQRAFAKLQDFIVWYPNDPRLVRVGSVCASSMTGCDAIGRRVFDVTVRCPDCETTMVYRNLRQELGVSFARFTPILCRNCGQRLNIENRDAFHANYTLTGNTWQYFLITTLVNFIFRHRWAFRCFNALRRTVLSDQTTASLIRRISRWSAS